jgi:hypothetical protein
VEECGPQDLDEGDAPTERLSITSILKSSVDSCNHLGIDRISPNGTQMTEKDKKNDWQTIKNEIKIDNKVAKNVLMNFRLNDWAKKYKIKNENA